MVSEAELALGVGEVAEIADGRVVDIYFPAVNQTRRYRIKTAPLRRVVLHVGQMAARRGGERIRIERVVEKNGLLTYCGQGIDIPEQELEDKIPLSGALDRLRVGSLGVPEELELHIAAWKVRAAMLGTKVRGLFGSRVSLLGHQLYVAHQVSRLAYPRVLLADQVGLGKTIESGLIFSALRSLGRADRVLIVVPDSLLHQWLAEMVRRFHELFRVVGKEAVNDDAPFVRNARCLTTWSSLKAGLDEQACASDWDLVIIDEAHHLHEGQYAHAVAQRLAKRTRGLLLLTGTPMRGGEQTEFSLLNLVDPQRYNDFERFCLQRQSLHQVSEVARALCEAGDTYAVATHERYLKTLLELIPDDEGLARNVERFRQGEANAQHELLEALIDRHGPGRVLFRNRRERLQKLFPGRHIELVPMRMPEGAVKVDPRLTWVVHFLEQNPQEKVVLIASKAEVVVALQNQLRNGWSIHSAVFYETLSLVERDRQAAWFASSDGPKLLICSEIGSEGRNFQFAHSIIFWDVPIQPDIIEQRIGRLDRIGQKNVVDVFVLYMAGTPVENLLRWHLAMGSFNGPVEGASEIVSQVDLRHNLSEEQFPAVLARSQELLRHYQQQAKDNVDYLVDLNSYNEEQGAELLRELDEAEKSCHLPLLINRLLEVFGVSVDETTQPGLYRLHAGNMLQVDFLAGLRPEGMLVTYDRDLALTQEEVEYLTPDHPLVQSVLSALLDSDSGCAVALHWKGAPKTGLLLQCLYVLEAMGAAALELYRYMPPLTILVTVDINGNLVGGSLPDVRTMKNMRPEMLNKLLSSYGGRLERLTEKTEHRAQAQAEEYCRQVSENAERQLQAELERLRELQRVNPTVSDEEIEQMAVKKEAVMQALSQAAPRLDGLRVILLEA